MMQRSRNDASESIRAADIPLRPEVIQCMDVQSLGRYTCSSATMRKDVREAKAWQLLSNVQRPAEESFFAAERNAAAARRSQAHRRRLVDQLDGWRAGGPMVLEPTINTFADFTFFLRIEDDEGRIWEGDLAPSSQRRPQRTDPITAIGFDVSEIWAALKERDRMVAFLATDPSDPDSWRRSYLDYLRISVVAVREADQAMIPLGQFSLDDALGLITEASQEYLFKPKRFLNFAPIPDLRLLVTERNEFCAFLTLNVTHDATGGGGGTLDSLEVGVTMLTRDYEGGGDYLAEDLECARVEYLFTYLAGNVGHYGSRGALATIEGWDD